MLTRAHTHTGSYMQTCTRAYEHTPQGIHVNTRAHKHIHGLANIHSNICHETYTPTSTDKRINANTRAHTNIHREAYMSTRMHARQAFFKTRSRGDPNPGSLSETIPQSLMRPTARVQTPAGADALGFKGNRHPDFETNPCCLRSRLPLQLGL